MSNLAERTLRKRISRPNGMKAIARIEREIGVLIANAPRPQTNDALGSIEQSNARINAAALVAALRDIYTKHVEYVRVKPEPIIVTNKPKIFDYSKGYPDV